MDGVEARPLLGGEEDLPRVGGALSRIEEDLPRTEVVLSCTRAAVLLRVRTGALPRGVDVDELGSSGEAVTSGISTLAGTGVDSLEVGAEPDTVRFLPASGVGAGLMTPAVPSVGMQWSPRLEAVAMKYLELPFLASSAISASYTWARLSSSLAFQMSHFSSTSRAAAFVAFSVNLALVWMYQSWYPSWPGLMCWATSSAVAARRWKSVG